MIQPDAPGITPQSAPFVDALLDHVSNVRPLVLKTICVLVFGVLLAVAPGITRWVVVALIMLIVPGALDLRGRLIKSEARSGEAEKEKGWACAALCIAMARVDELEAELAVADRRSGGASDPVYRSVGLDADAPNYVVEAARRAHRVALHPDKHPENWQAAHDRYVVIDAAFDKIEQRRKT